MTNMENTPRRIAGNTIFILSQRMAGNILGFVLTVYLARKMGALDFGAFNVSKSFVALFGVVADIGLTTLTIREVARRRDDCTEYLGRMVVLKLFLSLVYLTVVSVFSYFYSPTRDLQIMSFLLAVFFMFEYLGTFYSAVFQAYEKMGFILFNTIAEKLFLLLLCYVFLSRGYGMEHVGLAFVLSGLLYLFLNAFLVRRHFVVPRLRVDLAFWKTTILQGLPLAFTAVISMIYYNIGILLLAKMKDQQTAGWFAVSFTISYTLATLSGAFLTAVFPVMSRRFRESRDRLVLVFRKSFTILFAVGLPLSVGGVLLARKIILLIYGSQYEQSVLPFALFSSVFVFSYLNSLAGYFLTAVNRQLSAAKILAVTTSVNVLVNILLIPRFGTLGAATATVVSESLFFTIFYFTLPGDLRRLPAGHILKSAAAAAVMAATLLLLKSLPVLVLIPLGAIVYGAVLWFSKYLNEEDIALFKNVLGKT